MSASDITAIVLSTFGVSAVVLLICTGLLGLSLIFKTFHRNPRLVKFAAKLPGPPTVPVIGNGFDFFESGVCGMRKLMEYTKKYGSWYRLWFGRHLVLVTSNAEDLQTVFLSSKTLGKPPELCRPFIEHFGNGLFAEPVHLWKKHRKTIQPLFGKNVLQFYQSDMNRIIHNYLDEMKKLVDGPEFDLWNYIPFLVFDIITKTNFDVALNPREKSELEFHSCAKVMAESMFLKSLRPWLHFKFIRSLLNVCFVNKFKNKMYTFARKVTQDKMSAITESSAQNGNSLERGINSLSFLSTIYKQSQEAGDEKIMHDQIVTLSSAGTDTTAVALSFLLLAIAIHPDIQEKLYGEIYALFGDDDREADVADLERLPYLDQVLKESLRRFTAIPLIFRHVEEDAKIGSFIVPAETAIIVSTIDVHFNPQYYPDPYKFDPDHFSPDEVDKRPKLSYIPFSAGVRNCVGLNYALMMVKLTAVAFLRTYSLHSTTQMENIKLNVGFLTTSLYGYSVSLKQRNPPPKCDLQVD